MKCIANMSAIDARAQSEWGILGLTLMESAGHHVALRVKARALALEKPRPVVTILCGKGNNGGDGFVCARHLAESDLFDVSVVLSHAPSALRGDALAQFQSLPSETLRVMSAEDMGAVEALLEQSDCLVDALFGSGLSREITGVERTLIELMNASPAPCVSVDLPSGIDGATGAVLGVAVKADETVTFAAPKPGLYWHPGKDYAGRVWVVDIGIPPALIDADPSKLNVITPQWVNANLPRRAGTAHKYSVGSVLVIAGSKAMPGAAVMTASSALKAGAGVVKLATSAGAFGPMALPPEIMHLALPDNDWGGIGPNALSPLEEALSAASVVVVGPGLGQHPKTVAFLSSLFWRLKTLPNACVVVDADALNALAILPQHHRLNPRFILTPHLGEAARLLNQPKEALEADLPKACWALAEKFKATVVLKSATSCVASGPDQLWINPTGNPGMATAGSGDVLAGLIAGFYAQGLAAESAACVGTYLHGLAGDHGAQALTQYCLTATDILRFLPEALKDVMAQ